MCVFPASLPGWLHVTGERCWWNRARLSRRGRGRAGRALLARTERSGLGAVSERSRSRAGSPLPPPPPSPLGFPAAVSPSPRAALASRLARCSEKWKPNRQENPARKERKIKRLPQKKKKVLVSFLLFFFFFHFVVVCLLSPSSFFFFSFVCFLWFLFVFK